MSILLFFSFLAGIATVLSPCILPVLPALLSASATGGKGRPLGVILGLVISFVFFTLALTTLVKSFGISANVLRYVAISIIGFFGIVLIIPSLSDKFAMMTSSFSNFGTQLQGKVRGQQTGFTSGLIIGAALGLVWTPCAGPILAAITTLVATQQVTFSVILLTMTYSLGAALPLLLIAYGGHRALNMTSVAKHTEMIRKIFGFLMILTAFALAFNWDTLFQQTFLNFFPNIQIEKNALVEEQLQQLRGPSPLTYVNAIKNDGKDKGELPNIAAAPPIKGISTWINSFPLTIEQLKGKVVLLDFWTYSCINCIRTFPYLRRWYEDYKDLGFVIIGIHTPEFEFEKDEKNVKNAVERFQLTYPVGLDNQYQTWKSYYNSYWPAHYLIDQNGIVREFHHGEGNYLETENAIRSLLNLPSIVKEESQPPIKKSEITPETYLGYQRAQSYSPAQQIVHDEKKLYQIKSELQPNQVGLEGEWTVASEHITSDSDRSIIKLNFQADQVYLVLGGRVDLPIKVMLDDNPVPKLFWTADMNERGEIFVNEPRKYDIVDLKNQNDGLHVLTLSIPKGIQAYAFTFGSSEK